MKHEIKFEDFENCVITHELAGSYGNGSHKTLNCVIPVTGHIFQYEVLENKKVVLKTFHFLTALEKYNELD